ncbi:GNAT family N-acetyltransferase [Paenibacillus sp. 1001270B_150601_E10]|uniref:GNAT family N-acetyltransferase n=1 Tax=Paenibacillus sp. 1001270B_150601_E10 TaxID=2787079 RepID=UPI00189C6C25|nr:GNAT family N-acetyltransferase [Paenibacillus sp. 1001270B_150601_E10]
MTETLSLVEPSNLYKADYLEMTSEWRSSGEKLIPWVLRFDSSNFQMMLDELHRLKHDQNLEEGKVNSSTYWLRSSNQKLLGAVNIRHRLNEALLSIGGHIGYGIRPTERKKGYSTELLRLALIEAKALGITKALVTCDKDNVGSARTIMNNGGVLSSEAIVDGVEIQRYWMDIE